MNLASFEKSEQEKIIQAEARGESDAMFAEHDLEHIKHKIEKRKIKQKRAKGVLIVGGVAFLVLLVVTVYSQYKLYTLSQAEKTTVTTSAPKTGEEVLKALKRHILVPEGNPQIAEVNDAEKLSLTQPFFKDVVNGDIVVVYDTIIFIYRPSLDIVVASGDITAQTQVKP